MRTTLQRIVRNHRMEPGSDEGRTKEAGQIVLLWSVMCLWAQGCRTVHECMRVSARIVCTFNAQSQWCYLIYIM